MTKSISRTGLVVLVFSLLGACQGGPPTPSLSPSPSPAPTNPTPTDPPTVPSTTPSPAPLTEATQPIVLESPQGAPTAMPLPPPLHLPDSEITIFEPGPGSQVRSPFRVVGRGGPSFEERVRIRLFGEDGRLLDDRITILLAYPGNAGRFVTNLGFDTPFVGELGTLRIDTFERRYGNVAHRVSQELVLLSEGSEQVRPGHQGAAQLALTEPQQGALVPMGTVEVAGGGWTTGHGPIVVQAYDRSGQVVASSPVQLDADELGEVGLFSGALQINLNRSQYGRLAVAELSEVGAEPRYLYSIEVYFQR